MGMCESLVQKLDQKFFSLRGSIVETIDFESDGPEYNLGFNTQLLHNMPF